jgi:Icc-related predicted phosphoesterase
VKILCISDYLDPLVYSTSIKERFGDVDFALSAGDLPMDYLEFIVSSLDRPLYHVFGNHNLEEYDFFRHGAKENDIDYKHTRSHAGLGTTFIGGKMIRESGGGSVVLVAGLGGSLRYNKGRNQWTEAEMRRRIIRLLPRLIYNYIRYGRALDILLTPAPPLGIHDRNDPCHTGFKCFLTFMKVFKPKYLLHGHIHLYDASEVRRTKYRNTDVINVYGHYILNCD